MTAKADTNPLREALEKVLEDWFGEPIEHMEEPARVRTFLLEPLVKAAAALASEPVAGTEREALPEFEDPRVQIVYEMLCDDELNTPPNPEEHWEGWVSRNIVAALSAPPAPAGREAELAAEVKRLRDGLQSIVDLKNPLPRAAVREACAEILAGGPAVSPQGGRATVSAPLLNGLIQDAIDALHPDVADDTVETFERSQLRKKFSARLLATSAPGAADRAAVIEWQDISTAPKDGTPMLFCHWENPEQDVLPIMSGFWSRLSEGWYAELSGQKMRPTHWRPLPTPPTLPRADRIPTSEDK